MKQNTLVHLILSLTILTALAVSTASASPTAEPPLSNVSPNFSALTVQNNAEVGKLVTGVIEAPQGASRIEIKQAKIDRLDVGLLSNSLGFPFVVDNTMIVNKDVTFNGNINLENTAALKNINADPYCYPWQTCVDYVVDVKDDLHVSEDITGLGKLQVNGDITSGGKIGAHYFVEKISTSNSAEINAQAFCNSGDFRISCNSRLSGSYSGVFPRGTAPWYSESCYASAYNSTGSSISISAYAYCFSPNG